LRDETPDSEEAGLIMSNVYEKKSTVLLMDVEAADLAILNSILFPDYSVITAQSENEGFALAAVEKPDLILLEVKSSSPDGFAILKEMKINPETQGIPVIVITGNDNEADEELSFNLGAVDYFPKPFKNVIVKVRVRTQLEMINQIRTIERLGWVDPLTNIPNRRRFDDRLSMEWRRCLRDKAPISFLMMDVDKFKAYNDTYGHLQGDMLLKSLAKILESSGRRPADLAARLGGEEFGLLLPYTPLESALDLAEKLRAAVEALSLYTVDGKIETRTTISIGAASVIPAEGVNVEDLLRKADECLYEAKAAGRNRVCSGKS
jgi:diguanylate cyclase (GGDEF)-like protein